MPRVLHNLTPMAPPSSDRESVLENLIEDCANRLQAGEPIDVEELARRHPEHSDRLRRLLPSLEMMAEVGRMPIGLPEADLPTSDALGPPLSGPFELGDYRVLRSIGKGGMGIVYEAIQVSLNRRVALKLLPFAAALDPHQLRRFQTEAQAAAQLHHTNIVPVFAVGCERGVHFYAMQFIEGRTIAAVIQERRDISQQALVHTGPTRDRGYVRSVARLGIQAAEALDHAHHQGIIHRDIKPANILVDVHGNLWITDFGLARFINESGLTLTGDLIGTLRYMSPEQALAKRLILDHRTDIYSLGATLYELLTLHPVVEGRDRQEVLRRIAEEQPIPPRRIDPALPRDVETILLKCLAREPEDRYVTAQELADDLRRLLEHRPIKARRPNLLERAAKWSLRHQWLVVTAVIGLVLAVAGLTISVVLINRARGEALRQRDEARARGERGDRLYRLARQAVDEMYTQFAEEFLSEETELADVKRVFLLKGLRYYQQFAEEGDSGFTEWMGERAGTVSKLYRSLASRRVGDIQLRFGHGAQAEISYRRAAELLRNLPADTRTVAGYRYDRANSLNRLGLVLMNEGRLSQADAAFAEALAIWDDLAADYPTRPTYHRERIRYLYILGILRHAGGRLDEAEAAYRRALGIGKSAGSVPSTPVPSWAEPPEVYGRLGLLLHATGRLDEAERSYRYALGLIEHRRAEFPDLTYWRPVESFCHQALGALLLETDRIDQAGIEFRRSQAIEGSLHTARQGGSSTKRAHTLNQLGLERLRQRDVQVGVEYRRQARILVTSLVTDLPDVSNSRLERAVSHNNLAWEFAIPANPDRDAQQAVFLARKAVELDPENGTIWNTLGVAYCRTQDWKAAIDALEKSMKLRNGGDSYDWFFLAIAHHHLGNRVLARRWYDQGLQWMSVYAPKDEQLHSYGAEAASLLRLPIPPQW